MGSEVPVRASSALPAPQAATEAAALRSGSSRTPPPRDRSGSAVKACDSLSRRCVRARRSAALCLHGGISLRLPTGAHSVLLRGLSVALSLSPLISSIYRVPVLAKWRVLLRSRAPEAGSRAGGEAGKRRRGLEPGPCAQWRGREPPAALRPGAQHGSTAQHGQGAHVEGAPWLLSGSEGEQQGSHQEGRLMTMFLITTWR